MRGRCLFPLIAVALIAGAAHAESGPPGVAGCTPLDATPMCIAADPSSVVSVLMRGLTNLALGLSDSPRHRPSITVIQPAPPDAARVAFVEQLRPCWIAENGKLEVNGLMIVQLSLTGDGKVAEGSIKLEGALGLEATTAETKFESARRAILACEGSGYPVPPAKGFFAKGTEITFSPEGIRVP